MFEVEAGFAIAAALLATILWRLRRLQARDEQAVLEYPWTGTPDWLNPDVAHVDTKARARRQLLHSGRQLVNETLTPPEAAQVRIHITEVTSARGWPHPYLELDGPPALLAQLSHKLDDLNSSATLAGSAPPPRNL